MPRFDAASISSTSSEVPAEISRHESHVPSGSAVGPFTQFKALARIRALVVLPTPRTPEKMYACATRFELIAFASVRVTCCCPTISLNVCGRYFRAITLYVMECVVRSTRSAATRGTSGTPRHTRLTRYRCSLPGLAGFAGNRCTEPEVPPIGSHRANISAHKTAPRSLAQRFTARKTGDTRAKRKISADGLRE